MSFIELISISIALGLDASGVCVSLGLNRRINKKIAIYIIGVFAFFQFLLALIGGLLGYFFNSHIFNIPKQYGGIILLILGTLMVLEGFSKDNKSVKINWNLIVLLAISVSIDALIVGFSAFHHYSNTYILFEKSTIVGLVTAILCTIAFFISKHVRRVDFIKEYADFIGGIVLIIYGMKMIFM